MGRYLSIQYLRAIAALAVVFHHARNPLPWLYNPLEGLGTGQAGCDIFFVISGFIMANTAARELALEFVWRRLIRIAPLYWIATAMASILAVHHQAGLTAAYAVHVVKSILFIPHYSLESPGNIWPCLIPGWTLDFEIFFYMLFAMGLAFRNVFMLVAISIGVLFILGWLLSSPNAIWSTYSNPLLLEFLGGMLIARYRERLTRPLAMVLLPIGIVTLALGAPPENPRVIVWGLPAVAIVTGALAIERAGWLLTLGGLTIIGDASYAIYLFQTLGISIAHGVVRRLPLVGMAQFVTTILAAMASAVALGVIVHYTVERPILRVLRGPRPPRPIACGPA